MPDGDVRAWPQVALGEVLRRRELDVIVTPNESYHFAGVQSFGRGVFRGNRKRGSEFSYPRLTRVRAGDVTFPKLMAWEGAIGVVPEECDGLVVSPEFPVFEVDRSRAVPRFLDLVLRSESFWPHLSGGSIGTNVRRRRLHPDDFVSIAIPLPPLAEQRRVADRVDALCAKIDEALGLRCANEADSTQGLSIFRAFQFDRLSCVRRPIADLFTLHNGRGFEPRDWGSVGRKIVRIQNLKHSQAAFNYFAGPVDDRHLVQRDDVLFAWSGQIVSLGAHVWAGDEAVLNQHIFKVVSKQRSAPRYVAHALNHLVRQMHEKVRGLEMFHIRKQELETILFPWVDLAQQHEVADVIDRDATRITALRNLAEQQREDLLRLRSAVIERAVRGEL